MDFALRFLPLLATPAKLVFVVGAILAYLYLFAISAIFFGPLGWLSIPLVLASFLIVTVSFLGRRLGYIYFAAFMLASVPILLSFVSVEMQVHNLITRIDQIIFPLFLLTLGLYSLNGVRQGGTMLVALLIAAMAFGSAWLNDDHINKIQVEHAAVNEEVENAKKDIADADEALAERLGETGGQKFLEQGAEDAIDWEGMTTADAEALKAKLEAKKKAEAVLKRHGETYSRRDVKTERQVEGEVTEEDEKYAALGEEAEDDATEALVDERTFTVEESLQARDYAATNKLIARMVAYMAFLLAVVAYFRQFNWTFPHLAPVPIGGRWLDDLCPKENRVYFKTSDKDVLRYFLELAARKGESFIYFGDEYLITDGSLPRWVVAGKELPINQLKHLRDDEPQFFENSDFVFESAWFGRYAFSIKGFEQAQTFLLDFFEQVRLRRTTKARVRHTLNIVWTLEEEIPPALFETLSYCVAAENMRLIIVGQDEPSQLVREHTDGYYDDSYFTTN